MDPRSHCFLAMIDLHKELTEAFPGFIWKRFSEGVDSAPPSDVDKVNETLRIKAFQLDADHIGWNRHTRLC
eukprot:11698871-Karenia_brevis.AAC.1